MYGMLPLYLSVQPLQQCRSSAMNSLWSLCRLLLVVCYVCSSKVYPSRRRNVLMLIADDMRPEIGAFYDPVRPYSMYSRILTPSLNALAARSLVLRRAYVQQAICAPSRLSFLTSRRPDTTLIYTIEDTYWRNVAGNLTTIPQFFKQNGYRSIGIGKVFHHGPGSDHDDPPSWTDELYRPTRHSKDHWYDRENSWQAVNVRDRINDPLPDDQVADRAVRTLRQLAATQATQARQQQGHQPFFMAVGFYKPHLPFVFPSQYLSLYPIEHIDLPRPAATPIDTGIPSLARTRWEINKYRDIAALNMTSSEDDSSTGPPLPDDVTRQLRRAYYCTVSYIDDLIGRIIWELEQQGLANDTVVAFLGDHGWHLGESNLWGKHTNFELSTRAPLMIRIPGLTDTGLVYDRPVEFVDLFPTLVEAAGLDALPVCPGDTDMSWRVPLCTEGASLMPLVRPSTSGGRANGRLRKQVAFSQYPRRGFSVMGYSVRTDRYRYTEWAQRRPAHKQSLRWRVVHAVELYDHVTDPDETVNVADNPSYALQRSSLEVLLVGGWRAALFPNETLIAMAGTGIGRRTGFNQTNTRLIPRMKLVTLRPSRRITPTSSPGNWDRPSDFIDSYHGSE